MLIIKIERNMIIKSQITHTCIYHKKSNGMGGVAIEKSTELKINILETMENFALDKDEILVVEDKEQSGQLYGVVQTIIKHNTTNLLGMLQLHKSQLLLKVTNPKFGNYLVKVKSNVDKIDRETVFNSVITSYPDSLKPYFEVELTNSIGTDLEDSAYIAQIIKESNLPLEFSSMAISEALELPKQVEPKDIQNRIDLRNIPFVTIDGADAKDFDDAVYCNFVDGAYNLYVAIADVSHYVVPNSALDNEAYLRSTSVYFPKQVIPMLPEKISNGLCSLNPHVDRLVICCQMKISTSGEITEYKVYNGVIHSAARLTYSKMQEWLNETSKIPPELAINVANLYLVFQALLTSRNARGAIDFETVEPIFIFDDQGLVKDLQPKIRLETHKLIEECMLAANVCVADFLLKNKHPGLFRIHDRPSAEKFTNLKHFLNSIAISFDVKYENLAPHHFASLLKETRHHPQFPAIQQSVLRSMQLAMYSPNNIGHFGLSYDRYLHFTSPIRRYPDLLVHRAIKQIIANKKFEYARDLSEISEHTSFTERRAENLERKIDAFYKCQYAKTHIGKEYSGLITSVVNFGVFVYIPDLMLDGLVHVTELGHDYFVFDEKRQTLIGKKTGIKFSAGDDLHIQIVSVDMAKLFIDLKIVSDLNMKTSQAKHKLV